MEKLDRTLAGSLNALLVLESAVRHGNFSLAARNLNLSQPAVSRHISILEERLGQSLFQRNNNQIAPTDNARRLADAVALGLGHIREAWKEIYAPPDRTDVILACTFGFADQWLMPRFSNLRAAMNGVQVRVITTDQLADIDPNRVDAAVVWNVRDVPNRPAIPLFPEEAFPICSPEFAHRELKFDPMSEPTIYDPGALRDLPPNRFLHFDVGNSGYLTWDSWFAMAGLNAPHFVHRETFDAYPFLLQAVLNGEGIALGWRGLVDEMLAQGRVLRAGPIVAHRETAYYLQHRPTQHPNAALVRLVAWFRSEALHSPYPPKSGNGEVEMVHHLKRPRTAHDMIVDTVEC